MFSRGEFYQKGSYVCEFLNIDDKGFNNDYLLVCIVFSGVGLDFEDVMFYFVFIGSYYLESIEVQ